MFKTLSEFSVCYSLNREDIQHAEMLHYSVLPSFFQDFFQKSVLEKGSLSAREKAYFARKLKAVMDLNKALRGLLKRASSHTYPRNQKGGFATRLSEHCWALSSHLIPALSAEAAIKANKTVSIIRKDAKREHNFDYIKFYAFIYSIILFLVSTSQNESEKVQSRVTKIKEKVKRYLEIKEQKGHSSFISKTLQFGDVMAEGYATEI